MTVSSETFGGGPYEGNGTNDNFAWTGKFDAATDFVVKKTSTTGVVTTLTYMVDYTVTGLGAASGSVTYPISGTKLAAGEYLTIIPALPYKQLTDLISAGGYRAENHEGVFDYVTRLIQQVKNSAARALQFNDADGNAISGALPVLSSSAGTARFLKVKADGTGFEFGAGTTPSDSTEMGHTPGGAAGTVSAEFDSLSSYVENVRGLLLADVQALTIPTASDAKRVTVAGRTANGDGYAGEFSWNGTDLSTEVAADTLKGIYIAPTSDAAGASGAWVRDYSGHINVKWFGAFGDGTNDDTTAITVAKEFAADKILFFPDGDYVIQEQINIDTRMIVKGESKTNTRIFAKGTPVTAVQTYQTWRTEYDSGNYATSSDSAIATVFAITAPQVHFEDLRIFGWYDATVSHTTPFASYPLSGNWDIGILVQTTDFTFDRLTIDGLWNAHGMLFDASQPGGSVDRGRGTSSVIYGRWGLGIIGADGQGAAPNFATLVADDTRGAGGASDLSFYNVICYGSDINLNTDLGYRYVRRFSSDAGGLKIHGQLSYNTAKRIQGIRFFGCRLASFDPHSYYLNFCNRIEFHGCHSEFKSGGYDTDGTTALTSLDFTGIESTKNAKNIKFFGGEKSGEPDNLTYSDATEGNLISQFAWDEGGVGQRTLIVDVKDSGSWTPVLAGEVEVGTPVYSDQTGKYTRIGDVVIAQAKIAITSRGGMTGNIYIDGLPYKGYDVSGTENGVSIAIFSNITFTGVVTGIVENNVTQVHLYDCASGSSPARITHSAITDAFNITFTAVYKTNDVVSL